MEIKEKVNMDVITFIKNHIYDSDAKTRKLINAICSTLLGKYTDNPPPFFCRILYAICDEIVTVSNTYVDWEPNLVINRFMNRFCTTPFSNEEMVEWFSYPHAPSFIESSYSDDPKPINSYALFEQAISSYITYLIEKLIELNSTFALLIYYAQSD